jgi:hypothetical protein
LREEHRLTGFENRVLRTIQEDGSWRRLDSDELHSLYSSRKMRWARHVARMGREEVFTEFGWEA